MKKTLSLLALLTFSSFVSAQEVKFDDDKVLIDKTERFSFNRKSLGDEFSLYKLNTKDEIIYMALDRNGTQQYQADDFKRFTFLESKTVIESNRLKFTSWKAIIKLLLEDKVLDLDGTINTENLAKFAAKYNDVKN